MKVATWALAQVLLVGFCVAKAVMFKTDEISALLRTDLGGAQVTSIPRACDVSFVLFLESPAESDPKWSFGEWFVDAAIKKLCPFPQMAHVELLAPPIPNSNDERVHFATYLGADGANWQSTESKDEGVGFYLVENGARWRALPVFGANVAAAVREAAQTNVHAPYSLGMYLTSAPPLRALAKWWGDSAMHKGHCAVLTARVLKQAGIDVLKHTSPYYSPSTLYKDLFASVVPLDDETLSSLTSVAPQKCKQTIDTLLRAPLSYATVREVGDVGCIDAVRALTLQVYHRALAGDEPSSRVAQKQLATALLRWVLLRDLGDLGDLGSAQVNKGGAPPHPTSQGGAPPRPNSDLGAAQVHFKL